MGKRPARRAQAVRPRSALPRHGRDRRYRQIISLPNPPIEDIAEGAVANNMAKVANDSMAELWRQAPGSLSGFRRSGVDARRRLLDRRSRARHQDGRTRGCRPSPTLPVIRSTSRASAILCGDGRADLPIWAAPGAHVEHGGLCLRAALRASRCGGASAGPTRPPSRCAGWFFDGIYDRHTKLKIITHHLGGGMIPFFDGRIGAGMEVLGSRTIEEDHSQVLSSLKRPHLDISRSSTPTPRCSAAPTACRAASSSSAAIMWCCVRRAARRHPDARQGA